MAHLFYIHRSNESFNIFFISFVDLYTLNFKRVSLFFLERLFRQSTFLWSNLTEERGPATTAPHMFTMQNIQPFILRPGTVPRSSWVTHWTGYCPVGQLENNRDKICVCMTSTRQLAERYITEDPIASHAVNKISFVPMCKQECQTE